MDDGGEMLGGSIIHTPGATPRYIDYPAHLVSTPAEERVISLHPRLNSAERDPDVGPLCLRFSVLTETSQIVAEAQKAAVEHN